MSTVPDPDRISQGFADLTVEIQESFADMLSEIRDAFARNNERFDAVEKRLDAIEAVLHERGTNGSAQP